MKVFTREPSATIRAWQLSAWTTLTRDAQLDWQLVETSPATPFAAAMFFGRDLWTLRALADVVPHTPISVSAEIARCYMIHRVRTDLALLAAVEHEYPHDSTRNTQFEWLDERGLLVKSFLDLRIFEWIPREIVCIENQAAFEAALAEYRSNKS